MKSLPKGIASAIAIMLFVLSPQSIFSQNDSISGLKQLDKLISEKNFTKAKTILQTNIEDLIAKQQFYEVTDYVYYLGKITLELDNPSASEIAILDFEKRIRKLTQSPKALRQLQLEMGSFYDFLGNTKTAIEFNLKALELTEQMPDKNGELFGIIYSNLGVFTTRIGDIPKALKYHKKALEAYKTYPDTKKESFYITYNSLGGMMWYISKIDSALVYYKSAENALKTLEQTPMNAYLRPAILNNNMAGILNIQGDTNGALDAMQKTVTNLTTFLKADISNPRRDYALEFLYQAIENYGSLYKEIGDYKKAKELINYAYKLKRKNLSPDSPEISKGKVLLGQINLSLKEYDEAKTYLDESVIEFKKRESDYFNWLADAYYYKAILNEETQNETLALTCYEEAERYYKASLGDYYDELYLGFVNKASRFYAKQGFKSKALQMANEAHDYIVANQGEKTLLEYHQVLNLANIEYELKNYESALEKSERALALLNDSTFTKNTQLGKLRIEVQKPAAILTKTKAEYQLKPVKDTIFLKAKLNQLQKAISILEVQKSAISDESNVSILLSDNSEIFEFAKQIALELYKAKPSETDLKTVLNLHESMLYNKIRSRLNSKTSMSYANLPQAVVDKEKHLKSVLNTSLSKDDDLDSFFKANKAWDDFLKELKNKYPKYYNLHYASISKSLNTIVSKIGEDKTFVRFAFINSKLLVFVIQHKKTQLFELESDGLLAKINDLQSDEAALKTNFELYNMLWKPLENSIITNNVVIIPDQILFNLNFEMLTPKLASSYQDLATNSLLAKHTISYNYSLFLIDKDSKTVDYDSNFIGFAPEFNSKMKSDYQLTITDSIALDNSYLTLLPQPFSKDLAKSSSKLFKGESFLNENASKHIFTSSANEHKIIHIGTHAESNNLSPELSRLIFAKNVNDSISSNDNSLYTYEIYNQNLSSNLAILTACETGKPTFQAGEGMISLAHAFNYAGSESILTSLWKIDEQSSTKIIEYFYGYLKEGLAKDKALQLAKLDYIATAKGRTLNPQYWAGLVLIGETTPIDLQTSSNLIYFLIGTLVIILIAMFFRKKRKT